MINEEEAIEFRMYVPEHRSTGTYYGIKTAPNCYKLTVNDPFNEALCYGTIIEVQPALKEEGVYELKGIYAESEFTAEMLTLPNALNESELRVVGKMITDEGGYWEVIFGGLAYFNLPKTSELNVFAEVTKMIKAKQEGKI